VKYYVPSDTIITLKNQSTSEVSRIQINGIINTIRVLNELMTTSTLTHLGNSRHHKNFRIKLKNKIFIVLSEDTETYWIVYHEDVIDVCRKHFGTRLFPEEVTVLVGEGAGAVEAEVTVRAGAGAGAVTVVDPPMTGGSRYKQLYNKYKNKYLLLKNK
jgi:hypothetical protein